MSGSNIRIDATRERKAKGGNGGGKGGGAGGGKPNKSPTGNDKTLSYDVPAPE